MASDYEYYFWHISLNRFLSLRLVYLVLSGCVFRFIEYADWHALYGLTHKDTHSHTYARTTILPVPTTVLGHSMCTRVIVMLYLCVYFVWIITHKTRIVRTYIYIIYNIPIQTRRPGYRTTMINKRTHVRISLWPVENENNYNCVWNEKKKWKVI